MRKSSEHNSYEHHTRFEKQFLDKLGSYSTHNKSTRLELLKMYKSTMKLRIRWADVNKYEIEKYIDKLIAREQAKTIIQFA